MSGSNSRVLTQDPDRIAILGRYSKDPNSDHGQTSCMYLQKVASNPLGTWSRSQDHRSLSITDHEDASAVPQGARKEDAATDRQLLRRRQGRVVLPTNETARDGSGFDTNRTHHIPRSSLGENFRLSSFLQARTPALVKNA